MNTTPPYTCWIFCNVIDNFGDIGVSWRLARVLQRELGWQVHLWTDDFPSLQASALTWPRFPISIKASAFTLGKPTTPKIPIQPLPRHCHRNLRLRTARQRSNHHPPTPTALAQLGIPQRGRQQREAALNALAPGRRHTEILLVYGFQRKKRRPAARTRLRRIGRI